MTDDSDAEVCGGCAALCDDVAVFRDGQSRVSGSRGQCPKGERWLAGQAVSLGVDCRVEGQPATRDKAVAQAEWMLARSTAPLMVGLTGLTVEAIEAAIELARATAMMVCPWPPDPTKGWGRQSPDMSRTWGEIGRHARWVVAWGCRPAESHPRLLERLGLKPDQVMIVAPPPGDEIGAVNAVVGLRCALERGEPSGDGLAGELLAHIGRHSPGWFWSPTGGKQLAGVAAGHVWLGPRAAANVALTGQWQGLGASLLRAGGGALSVASLGEAINARGATEALTWLTGQPGPVDFGDAGSATPQGSRVTCDLPSAGVTDADTLLANGLADVVINAGVAGDDRLWSAGAKSAGHSTGRGAAHRVGRIAVGAVHDPAARVSFAGPGLDGRLAGHVIRPDGIMLRLCGSRDGTNDPLAEVFAEIRRALTHGN